MSSGSDIPGLGGATSMIRFTEADLVRAVNRLLGCHDHHFAVVGEQQVLACSPMATECLQAAGLLPPGSWAPPRYGSG